MSKIFARFDADNDGCWDVKEIQAFANATNGKDFNDQEMTEFDNFEQKDGKLTETGFLNLYHLQITSYPDEVWKDLSALGLDRQEFVTAATKNAHDGVKKAAYQKPEVANHRLYEGVTLASVQELQKALAKNLRRLDRKIDADHSTYDEKEIVNVALERGRILKALEKLQG